MWMISSVLVGAGGEAGSAAAAALARLGVEVTLVAAAVDLAAVSVEVLRDLRVEVRQDVEVIGFVPVDRHVEAELSDGRVENYDIVVTPAARGRGWRVIASRDVQDPRAVTAVTQALDEPG